MFRRAVSTRLCAAAGSALGGEALTPPPLSASGGVIGSSSSSGGSNGNLAALMQSVENLQREVAELKREKARWAQGGVPVQSSPAADDGSGLDVTSASLAAATPADGDQPAQQQSVENFLTGVEKVTDEAEITTLPSDDVKIAQDGNPERICPISAEQLYRFYAQLNAQGQSMRSLMTVETMTDLLHHAHLMWREFQVRIARRTVELASAPFGLSTMPSIQSLLRWYEISFQDLGQAFPQPPVTEEDLRRFDELMRKIFVRHGNTAYLFGGGLFEFSKREGWNRDKLDNPLLFEEHVQMENFFHDFVKSRVSLRFLIQHYLECSAKILRLEPTSDFAQISSSSKRECVALHSDPTFGHDENAFIGAVCNHCSIPKVAQYAVAEALEEARQDDYDDLPEIKIQVAGDANFTFPHSPAMSHNIIAALVSDAIRQRALAQARSASVLGVLSEETLSEPIKVLISQHEENKDVVVGVMDTCGGIPHDLLPFATSYVYSVRTFFEDRDLSSPSSAVSKAQGWMRSAVRVPYAKAAAQVFGGDVTLHSMEGFSTDRQYYIPTKGLSKIYV